MTQYVFESVSCLLLIVTFLIRCWCISSSFWLLRAVPFHESFPECLSSPLWMDILIVSCSGQLKFPWAFVDKSFCGFLFISLEQKQDWCGTMVWRPMLNVLENYQIIPCYSPGSHWWYFQLLTAFLTFPVLVLSNVHHSPGYISCRGFNLHLPAIWWH